MPDDRARRRQAISGTKSAPHERQVDAAGDDARFARQNRERHEPGERRSERARIDPPRRAAPVFDRGEGAVTPAQQRHVARRRAAHRCNVADDTDAEPPRPRDQRGRRTPYGIVQHERRRCAQPRIVDLQRIDRVADDAACTARGKIGFDRARCRVRISASVVDDGRVADTMRFFERRPVECERREHRLRREPARRVRCGIAGGRRPQFEIVRRIPGVERVRERCFPAERRQRVVERKIDQSFEPPARELADRERRVGGIGGPGLRIFGSREPAGLEFAVRQRHRGLRAQRGGRERELRAIVLADRERIALVPVPHRPHRGRRGYLHLVGVDEERRRGSDDIAHLSLEPLQVRMQVRRRIGVVVEIRTLIVVELDREHAIGDGPELLERAVQPPPGVPQVRGVAHPLRRGVVAVRVLQRRGRGITPFEHVVQGHPVLGTFEQPRRIAAVAPLVADHRAGTNDEEEPQLLAEPQHLAQIAARARVPVEIEDTVRGFVPVPRDVQIDRVGADLAHAQHRIAPALARNPFVKEGAADEEERPAVEREHRIAVRASRDDRMTKRRGGGGGRGEREQQRARDDRRQRPTKAPKSAHANAFAVP
nr:hypothetical protein [Vulcanimicrobium alpinum]